MRTTKLFYIGIGGFCWKVYAVFNSIDACGKDFTVRPITNCGKGDPMQIMRMGNGEPHIRGIATVKSVGA